MVKPKMEQIGFPNQEEFAQLTSEDIAKLVALTEEDSISKKGKQIVKISCPPPLSPSGRHYAGSGVPCGGRQHPMPTYSTKEN